MFGERIKKYRQLLGMSGNTLAERSNISPGFLSEIERTSKMPSLDTATKIASALEVPLDFLLRDTHEFALFTFNELTNQLINEETEKLNALIDILEVMLNYSK